MITSRLFGKWTALFVAISMCMMVSCTTDYVTGKRTFSLVSESQEIAMGRQADPQIVAEYGLYNDPQLADYVKNLGQRLAAASQRPHLEYEFRVLDSPVVNAFALPGGYVYITRGILANFNSEDEMAGVLGHEIGHVVARHGAEQMSRAQIAQLGLGVGSLISDTFQKFADVAQAGIGLLFLKFSRSQETEADLLGVEYSTSLGYDAHKMAGFFKTLGKMSSQSGQSLPSFLSTHPDPGDREVNVNQLADEWQAKIKYQPLGKSRYEYLQKIDGIVYGDNPRQGYVEEQMFYHPDLRFQFPVPEGWNVVNTPSTVQLISPDKNAAVQLSLGKSDSPEKEADEFISNNEVTVGRRASISVHGFSSVIVESGLKNEENDLRILSYFIKKDGRVFILHGFTMANLFESYRGAFGAVLGGFDEVRDKTVLSKKPSRLRIKKAPRSGELATVLAELGAEQDKFEELAILNEMDLKQRVEKSDWIKVVEPE